MTVILGLFVGAMSILHLVLVARDIEKMPEAGPGIPPEKARPQGSAVIHAFAKAPLSIAVAFLSIFIIFGVASLGIYHISLMNSGLTTSEDIKGRFRFTNPWYQGSFLKQALFNLCGPQYPSALDKNHRYDYFDGFDAQQANLRDYPYTDDGQVPLFPNTYIDPFVPGSFSLKRTENHDTENDSDSDDAYNRRAPSLDDSDIPPRRNSRDEKESLILGAENV